MPPDHLVFRASDIFAALSGTPADLQRRVWLLGAENTRGAFAGVFTRRRRDDIEQQPWRYHDTEEVEYVVQGRMHVQFGDRERGVTDEFEVGPGDLFYIAAGVRHRADAIGDELCVGLLFCPTPYTIAEGQQVETE